MQLRQSSSILFFCFFVTPGCGQWQEAERTAEKINQDWQPEATDVGRTQPTPQSVTPNQPLPSEASVTDTPHPQSIKTIEPFGLILSETTIDIDFVDWAMAPENRQEIEKAGALNETQRSLTLKDDLTLSFSRFAKSTPFKINTNGYKIMLIGADFGYLDVQTQKANGNSGDVVIYASTASLPSVDASGYAGLDGNDAICPPQIKCVPVTDQSTTRENPMPQLQWQGEKQKLSIDWSDPSLTPNLREAIRAAIITETPETLKSKCADDVLFLQTDGPKIRGQVSLTRELLHPKLTDEFMLAQSGDASLMTGGPGQDGFNAGNIRIFQLGEANTNALTKLKTSAGVGGRGGLNFKTPRSRGRDKVEFRSIVVSEQLDISNLSVEWKISCAMKRGLALLTHNSTLAGRFAYPTMNIQSELGFPVSLLTLPAIQEGRDDHVSGPERAGRGAPGQEGKMDFLKWQRQADGRPVIHPNIPLPKAIQNH